MAKTAKGITSKEKERPPIVMRPYDARYLGFSKAQFIEARREEKEKEAKLAEYKKSIETEPKVESKKK